MTDRDNQDPPSELLSLAPELTLRIVGGRVEIAVARGRSFASPRVLGVLEQFAQPRALGDAIDLLRTSSTAEFIEITSLVMRLREEGVLVGATRVQNHVVTGFDAPWEHVAMLDDRTRTSTLVQAVHKVVRRGDVVLDIGTGTGVLALEAARAGARRVYAIEAGELATAAEQVFIANGVSDRVQIVRGRSTSIRLPEKCDVLVSEIVGNDPLAEGIVPTFRDARHRFLKYGARLVPTSIELFALPVDIPEHFLAANTFTEDNVARWRETLDIDFGPLIAFADGVVNLPQIKPTDARSWTTAGDPVSLLRVDLTSTDSVLTGTATFVAQRAVANLGLLLYFEADLSAGLVLSTAPASAPDDSSWRCSIYRVARRRVGLGERVRIDFSGATGRTVLRAS
jgi:Ribosomal protein L11 methyltransferase (PrmA)